jgi:hypothetical protein
VKLRLRLWISVSRDALVLELALVRFVLLLALLACNVPQPFETQRGYLPA